MKDDKNSQTSYRNLEWVFITGEKTAATWAYCTEIFDVLNTIKDRQWNLSAMIWILPTAWSDNHEQLEYIKNKLEADKVTLDNLNIVEIDDTKILEEMKQENIKYREINNKNFLKYAPTMARDNFRKSFNKNFWIKI